VAIVSADLSKMDITPAPLLAPLDKVYDKDGNYLGMLDYDGIEIDHERVILLFMWRPNMTVGANETFYVQNADHVVK
jgi:hypothetical protein